jgi:predicted esterase
MIQKNIAVQKTARYFVLGEASENIECVWFVCHGYAELANYFLKKFDLLNDGKTLIVAPEALNRFYWMGFSGRVGASWMTKEDRETDIADYIAYLNTVYSEVMQTLGNKKVKTVAFGFSQGTATVGRWVANKKSPIDQLILWAGNFPHDVDLQKEQVLINQMKPILVYGDEDEFMTADTIKKNTDLFTNNYIAHTLIHFNGKHAIHQETLLEIAKNV